MARRSLTAFALIIGVVLFNFFLIHSVPGDPALLMAGEVGATEEYLNMLREEWGLNKPFHEQLVIYLKQVFSGNLGYSMNFKQPVLKLVLERAQLTILLSLTSMIIIYSTAVFLGVASAKRPGSIIDNLISTISSIAYAIPTFWLAQIVILVFAVKLEWFPTCGFRSLRYDLSGLAYYLDRIYYMVLPLTTMSLSGLALITRLTRANMLDILGLDYIIKARAMGLDEKTVIYKHALKNASFPIITAMGYSIGFVLSGSLLVETVFGWPGIGRLMYESALFRDYPVTIGILMITACLCIISNFITDLVYGFIDPRVRIHS